MRSKDSGLSWQEEVSSSADAISVCSSFQEALYQHLAGLVSDVFTHLLCLLERNRNLKIYQDSSAIEHSKAETKGGVCVIVFF